jgi:MFS family permease
MPGRDDVMQEFNVGPVVALLPYCLYTVGLAFGPVLAAPMSETFGRRPVYIIGIPICLIFIMGAGFSTNMTALSITRFLAGAFSSPGLSNGSGTIADVWSPKEKAIPMALFAFCPFAGPAFA